MTLVYGGAEAQQRSAFTVLPYTQVQAWLVQWLALEKPPLGCHS